METLCDVVLLTLETTRNALEIQGRYGYSFYDALILSSALENDCKYVISEDLQNGQLINGELAVMDSFI